MPRNVINVPQQAEWSGELEYSQQKVGILRGRCMCLRSALSSVFIIQRCFVSGARLTSILSKVDTAL